MNMVKVSKNERKYGANIDKKPPKKSRKREITTKEEIEYYKVLIDGSAFSNKMTYEDCMKLVNKKEALAKKLRRPMPSLILVKQ